jgi:hypothetical protein
VIAETAALPIFFDVFGPAFRRDMELFDFAAEKPVIERRALNERPVSWYIEN